jgi:predicted MFS family arabinose efflux permease
MRDDIMSSPSLSHSHQGKSHHDSSGKPVWLAAAAGLCATLVGLGLARFAYTPLIPALIADKWFSPADVVYLGAANLAGYLGGALAARPLSARAGAIRMLRGMMLLASICCFASAMPVSLTWFFLWRFLSGFAGGVIMVLAASTILPHTAPKKRGIVGGVIFAGVGLGIAASGTLVPLLLRLGLAQSWIGLGLLSALLTLISWRAWPCQASSTEQAPEIHSSTERPLVAIGLLSIAYGLNALALVPHMIFLVVFIARGLGQGIATGSQYWVLYGLGAIVGPLLAGHLADRSGFGPALRVAFFVQAIAILLPALSTVPAALIVSSIIVGGFTPGIVPLVLGRIHELLPHSNAGQRAAWAQATTSFALFQAVGAYGLSYFFQHTAGDYTTLFVIGAAAVTISLALDLMTALRTGQKRGSRNTG